MPGCGCDIEAKNAEQRRVLVFLLMINGVMFFVEIVAGLLAESTALLADSLDMLADAAVYAVALYAVGRSAHVKIRAARLSGFLQIILGLAVLFDIGRRALVGSEPESNAMIFVGMLALVANVICLTLIYKHRQGDVHMRASWVFSKNDVIANLGVIVGGLLVAYTGSPYPDWVIGVLIAAVVIWGGLSILRDVSTQKNQAGC